MTSITGHMSCNIGLFRCGDGVDRRQIVEF
jgi:hypothetical protein